LCPHSPLHGKVAPGHEEGAFVVLQDCSKKNPSPSGLCPQTTPRMFPPLPNALHRLSQAAQLNNTPLEWF
ncbi:hypothetical protein DV515_00019887, partial [Chloebia gouldiae]